MTKPCDVSYLRERIRAFTDEAGAVNGGSMRASRLEAEELQQFLAGGGMEVLSFESVCLDCHSHDALAGLAVAARRSREARWASNLIK